MAVKTVEEIRKDQAKAIRAYVPSLSLEDADILSQAKYHLPVQDQHPRLLAIAEEAFYEVIEDEVMHEAIFRLLINSVTGSLRHKLGRLGVADQ